MDTKFAILAAASLAVAACGGGAPDTLAGTLAGAAAHFNKNGLSLVNAELKPTGVKASVRGKDTLVVRIDGVATGRATFIPQKMQTSMRENVCGQDWNKRVFARGGKLRVELVSNVGEELPPLLFNHC
jgi:hypothetical protein